MEAIHFDAQTGHELRAHEIRSPVVGFISWQRLREVLRSAGELMEREQVVSFQVDDRGLSFRVTNND